MPKHSGKGGNHRRKGKNKCEHIKRELIFRGHGQEYVQVGKMFGYVRLGTLCHSRGKLKKIWINQCDILLIGPQPQVPESVKINETVDFVDGRHGRQH